MMDIHKLATKALLEAATAPGARVSSYKKLQQPPLDDRSRLGELFSPKYTPIRPDVPPSDPALRYGAESNMSAHDYIKTNSARDMFWASVKHAIDLDQNIGATPFGQRFKAWLDSSLTGPGKVYQSPMELLTGALPFPVRPEGTPRIWGTGAVFSEDPETLLREIQQHSKNIATFRGANPHLQGMTDKSMFEMLKNNPEAFKTMAPDWQKLRGMQSQHADLINGLKGLRQFNAEGRLVDSAGNLLTPNGKNFMQQYMKPRTLAQSFMRPGLLGAYNIGSDLLGTASNVSSILSGTGRFRPLR